MSESINSYIEDLFKYIDHYERDYATFEVEAFVQTYNGICAVFQALRQQREKAVEVDQVFLEKIKSGPINSSDLRQLTIQVLISFFETIADTDGRSNKAYLYCREFRTAKRDVTYFETFLLPLLVRDGSLNNNFKLNSFFLKEIGRFITNFGGGWNADVSVEEFKALPDHRKLLHLHMRRAKLGNDLLGDRNALEFHLQGVGDFEKLRQTSSLLEAYLKEWKYLEEVGFFDRLKERTAILFGKLKGLFSNYRYLRLSLTQRTSAYLFYGLVIVIFLFLAIFVPLGWNSYTRGRLAEFQRHAQETEKAIRG